MSRVLNPGCMWDHLEHLKIQIDRPHPSCADPLSLAWGQGFFFFPHKDLPVLLMCRQGREPQGQRLGYSFKELISKAEKTLFSLDWTRKGAGY